jgi:threonine aldolase
MYEFRSDTFTRPTDAMRAAMAAAEVGDDVWGEDPTVRALEERAAEAVGKEAAVLVPSGTMGNALGVRVHCAQGDELYAAADAHVCKWEVGGPAALWGVQVRMLPAVDGRPTVDALREVVPFGAGDDPHLAIPRLVWVENTAGDPGGRVWPLAELDAYTGAARELGLAVHVDGARLFNAAVALGVPAAEIARRADTVQFCLSKGLGAPVGSVLAGSDDAIRRARRFRKLLGGGMRQAGILAAAGLHALEHHVARLADDHRNARTLAEGLAETGRLSVDVDRVETNIVLADVVRPDDDAAAVARELAAVGVLTAPLTARRLRFVTSLEVDAGGVRAALSAAGPVLR